MSRPLAPCGSVGAYMRHIRRNEPTCAECRAAWAVRRRSHPSNRRNVAVRSRWRSIIVAAYRAEVAEETARQRLARLPGESASAARERAVYAVAARHPDVSDAALVQARQETQPTREVTS